MAGEVMLKLRIGSVRLFGGDTHDIVSSPCVPGTTTTTGQTVYRPIAALRITMTNAIAKIKLIGSPLRSITVERTVKRSEKNRDNFSEKFLTDGCFDSCKHDSRRRPMDVNGYNDGL